MWETRMLRRVKPTVYDEIENALAYYRYTFLSEIPRLYADIEDLLDARVRDLRALAAAAHPAHRAAGSAAIATATRS